jgi:hypothetical protein
VHKFKVGEFVRFDSSQRYSNIASGPFVVTKQLPERNGELAYRLKSSHESHERTAKEKDLIGEATWGGT